MPKARFANANDLATAMVEAVAGKYEKLNAAKVKAEQAKADNTPLPQGAREQGEVRVENSDKKAYIKPEISDIEDILPTDIAQYLKSVAKNQVLKKAGITPDVADKMRLETLGTYDSLLPSTLKMIEHFENKLAKGEKITPDDIYQAIQEFDSYWAKAGYGSKFQEIQRDLISKYWRNADKDFADKFNVAMTRTSEIMELRETVAKNAALKNGGITPDIATQMLRETSDTYGSLLTSTLKMIKHFENKLAKGEKITPDDIYQAIQEFDSYWAKAGYGSKFQEIQRDLISKYWRNADKDFADKFNVAMTRTPEIMELRETVAKNSALKNGGITPDIATQMLRETSDTYGALLPRTLDMISYLQAKIDGGAKLSSILVNEAFNKFNKEYTQAGYGSEFQNLQRDLISKYWKYAGKDFGKIYDVAKNLDIDTPVQEIRTEYKNAFDAIDKNVRAMGLDKIGKMSIRLKSQQSLYDKIANYMLEHEGATLQDAIKDVRDAIGARTVVKSGDFKNHPEVKALLDAGKEREAILRAAELQSAPAVNALKAEILKQEQNKNNFTIARISNYVSPDGIPYLSENQLADLKQFAANHGVKLKINLRIDPSDPKTPHKEVKTMEEAFKKFVKIIRDRAEREVPEYGDFAPVYEQFANPKKELSATDFMIKISKPPKSVENNEKIRNLEVVAYKLPAPYKAECIVATDTKEELMQKLQDSKLLKEINKTAESLAKDLDEF